MYENLDDEIQPVDILAKKECESNFIALFLQHLMGHCVDIQRPFSDTLVTNTMPDIIVLSIVCH